MKETRLLRGTVQLGRATEMQAEVGEVARGPGACMLSLAIRQFATCLANKSTWCSLAEPFAFTVIEQVGDELRLPSQNGVQNRAVVQDVVLFLGTQASRAVGDHVN